METLERARPSLWICQVNGDSEAGLALVREVRSRFPDIPIVITSSSPSIQEATSAIKMGVSEYVPGGADPERMWEVVEGILENPPLPALTAGPSRKHEARRVKRTRPVAVHPEMRRILDLAARIARTKSTVLIQGESGTGKEVIARYIHDSSDRSSGPFVGVNCAALPESLLESELFGHEKGAFTGAAARKKGKFELADGGTLLLDEISEAAISIQAKLLRVLQEREVDRVGGQGPVAVDVRVIATTNRDLQAEVRRGTFRQDLFYRLNVVPLILPPLRRRPDDIAPLAEHFLRETAHTNNLPLKTLSPRAIEMLRRMPWTGNVRELENIMERATLLLDSEEISPEDLALLTDVGAENGPGAGADAAGGPMPLKEMERRMIYKALEENQGNRTRASKVLGISVRTLRNKLNEYEREKD
jgi:two-component system response regulator FlrC